MGMALALPHPAHYSLAAVTKGQSQAESDTPEEEMTLIMQGLVSSLTFHFVHAPHKDKTAALKIIFIYIFIYTHIHMFMEQ